ncbi:MAG: DNA glycosylase AlkZ-like family protein, partial [Hyphomicrobiaceae bacterium]
MSTGWRPHASGAGKSGPAVRLSRRQALDIWLRAQRIDCFEPFGHGPGAVLRAVEHLGYVQIDTINVIERCHHHILFTRIPGYKRQHLDLLQARDKSVFEYWTHALSYVPTRDFRFFLPAMRRHRRSPDARFAKVEPAHVRKVLSRIRRDGPISIRDIDDDVLVEKDHAWASRKPSRRALQMAFHSGDVTVNERVGMLKRYELTDRHFDWQQKPRPATELQVLDYLLDRALLAQGVISLDSTCYLDAGRKSALRAVIEGRVKRKLLLPVTIEGIDDVPHWLLPSVLDARPEVGDPQVRLLSPF